MSQPAQDVEPSDWESVSSDISTEPQHGDSTREAYLLRVWRADAGNVAIRRASLENVRTRERVHFADLDQLICFLRDNVCS